jgi:hypothetical protein
MALQDDRRPRTAAGQEQGVETKRIPERRATVFTKRTFSLETGSWCRFQPLSYRRAIAFNETSIQIMLFRCF